MVISFRIVIPKRGSVARGICCFAAWSRFLADNRRRNDKGRVCVHRTSPELASQRPPLPLPPRQQRQLTPLPTAIDIDEADLADHTSWVHLEQFVDGSSVSDVQPMRRKTRREVPAWEN